MRLMCLVVRYLYLNLVKVVMGFNVGEIADLFQSHRDELGFVNTAQVKEKDTYTVSSNGKLAGAVICNHCIQKPQTTLYDIAVYENFRRTGIASELIRKIANDSPHDKIVAKCPKNLPANHFYRDNGWELTGVESGKNRELLVWRLDI